MTGRLSRASAISSLERSRSVTELLARKQNGRSASSRGVTNGPDPSQTLIDVTDAHRTLYSLLHRCLLSGSRHRHARIIGGDGAQASPYRPPQIVEPPEVDHRLHPSCARSGRPKTGRHRRFRSAGASARALPSAEFLFGRTRGVVGPALWRLLLPGAQSGHRRKGTALRRSPTPQAAASVRLPQGLLPARSRTYHDCRESRASGL